MPFSIARERVAGRKINPPGIPNTSDRYAAWKKRMYGTPVSQVASAAVRGLPGLGSTGMRYSIPPRSMTPGVGLFRRHRSEIEKSRDAARLHAVAARHAGLGSMGLDLSSLVGGAGGAGGIVSMFVKSPEQKAAEKAAKAQAAAAQAQVKAARIAAASASEGRASTQKILLIGGGVAAAGLVAWLMLRKK